MSQLYLSLFLGEENCALPLSHVKEVVPSISLDQIPHTPDYLVGAFNYRGEVLPVLDLSILSGKMPCKNHLSTRIIVVTLSEVAGLLGVLAEKVTETCRLEEHENIRPLHLPTIVPKNIEEILNTCREEMGE